MKTSKPYSGIGWKPNEDGSMPDDFLECVENLKTEQEAFYNSLPDPLLPPWLQYPDFPRGSMHWKMGDGESYVMYFMRWFKNLEANEKSAYLQRYPAPDGWRWIYERSSLVRD